MSHTHTPSLVEQGLYTHAKSNVVRLTAAQALSGANAVVVYATGSIVGSMLAPNQALATLPITIFVIGMAACSLPAGVVAQRYGRRVAFMIGTGCGVLVGLLSAMAVVMSLFWLFCAATFFGGAYAAVVISFRFAAADCVPPDQRPRALSFVMAGGILAGVIGPQLVTHSMNLWASYTFVGTFLAQAAVAAFSSLILAGVRLPRPERKNVTGGRPISVIVRQPLFLTAVSCSVVSYLLMNFLMTSAPLAMRMCGHTQDASNLGIQWHVIAMYAPSFVTGRLITRFSAQRVVMVGLLLTGLSIAVGLMGTDVAHFWLTLILLGIGWNFGFIGASTLVLECHLPEEKNRVQSFNDFIVFGTVAFGSFLSGGVLTTYGWNTVLWLSLVPLVLAILALARSGVSSRASVPV
jgi:MFS family permease